MAHDAQRAPEMEIRGRHRGETPARCNVRANPSPPRPPESPQDWVFDLGVWFLLMFRTFSSRVRFLLFQKAQGRDQLFYLFPSLFFICFLSSLFTPAFLPAFGFRQRLVFLHTAKTHPQPHNAHTHTGHLTVEGKL